MRSAVATRCGAERVDQLLERDHRAGSREVDGGDDTRASSRTGAAIAYSSARELLVVDGEALADGSRSSSSRSAFLL